MDEQVKENQIDKSPDITELAKALAKAQALMEPAQRGSENPFLGKRYADLAAVWAACRDPLTKNELSVCQLPTANGTQVAVTTILMHSSGQYIANRLVLTAVKSDPQGIGSAITYGRRYALSAIVGISAEDDDGNEASGKTAGKPQVTKPQSKTETTKLHEDLEKARKKVGDEAYFKVIGNEGYATTDEITNVAVGQQILRDLETVYRGQKGK